MIGILFPGGEGTRENSDMKIGMLTSGGDAPGLNAVIRAAVLKGTRVHGHEFVGFVGGYKGLCEPDIMPLTRHEVKGISKQGGTILGTSRTNPFDYGGTERVAEVLEEHKIDAIIAIGGEGSLAAAKELSDAGLPIVGVPKTVDNDLNGTDYTFGFDTAVSIATEAMDRLRTTGDSHSRCMVAEVMGRHVGWIALHSGMAAGAHAILIPERKTSMEEIVGWVRSAHDRGRAPSSLSPKASPSTRWTTPTLSAVSMRLGDHDSVESAKSWLPSSKRPQELKPGPPRWDTFSAVELPAPLTGSWPRVSV